MKQAKQGIYARYIKRILDILLSGCALIVLSPVLLIVAVLVRAKLGSPVIFCQERVGKDEKIFKMYKFRSMTDARDENGRRCPALPVSQKQLPMFFFYAKQARISSMTVSCCSGVILLSLGRHSPRWKMSAPTSATPPAI